MLDKVKVAAAQIVPAFMKKDPTVQRVCDAIHKAAANGAQLIVFPETLIPGYPYWRSLQPVSRWSQLMVEYQKNALLIPSDDTATDREAKLCTTPSCSSITTARSWEDIASSCRPTPSVRCGEWATPVI
jgi:apolipoprotein N-acyltransferase